MTGLLIFILFAFRWHLATVNKTLRDRAIDYFLPPARVGECARHSKRSAAVDSLSVDARLWKYHGAKPSAHHI